MSDDGRSTLGHVDTGGQVGKPRLGSPRDYGSGAYGSALFGPQRQVRLNVAVTLSQHNTGAMLREAD